MLVRSDAEQDKVLEQLSAKEQRHRKINEGELDSLIEK